MYFLAKDKHPASWLTTTTILWALAAALLSSLGIVFADSNTNADGENVIESATSYLQKADKLLISGNPGDALIAYTAAIDVDPNVYLPYYKRATAYLSLNRLGLAARDLSKSIELNPHFYKAYEQRAKIYIKEGRFVKAGDDIEYLKSNFSKESKADKLLTSLQSVETEVEEAKKSNEAGNYSECVKYATKAIEVCPFFGDLRSIRYECNLKLGDIAGSVNDLQRLSQFDKEDLGVYTDIANLRFFYLGEKAEAIASLKECLHSDPENKQCKALFKQLKQLDKSLKKLDVELKKDKWNTCGKMISPPSKDSGEGLLAQVTKLDEDLSKKYQLPSKPTSNIILMRIIDVACISHSSLKRWKLAEDFCSKSLENNPDNIQAVIGMSSVLLEKDEFDKAISLLEEAQQKSQGQNGKINKLLHEAQKKKRMAGRKDYYKILGVPKDADQREIKKAFRKMAQQWHPDRYKGDLTPEQVQDKMSDINQAYEVLSDEKTRAEYDQGHDPNDPTGGHEYGGPGGFGGEPGGGNPFFFYPNGQQFVFKQGGSGEAFFEFGGAGGGGGKKGGSKKFKQYFGGGFPF
ncbi:hypothetical protein H4219_005910 [Mycoemilia scoparia]|uniref:J domain-containing protein n=1 Tax=Mycoemilia scoparia TaxID=417184 RepID=A0A9W8DNF8_9FUNG|nr:hypothetical protein H4219_005910 [Mycoemilia scoparia]